MLQRTRQQMGLLPKDEEYPHDHPTGARERMNSVLGTLAGKLKIVFLVKNIFICDNVCSDSRFDVANSVLLLWPIT